MIHISPKDNKLELFVLLLELTKEQEKSLKNDDQDNLLMLIEKKQEIINKIDKIQMLDESKITVEDVDSILDIISEQQKIENRIELLLEKKVNELKSKMASVRKENKIAKSYKGYSEEESKFFDKRR